MQYDLIVIGGDACGQEGAFAAAELNKRVAVVERGPQRLGGMSLPCPADLKRATREAVLHLARSRCVKPSDRCNRAKRRDTMNALRRMVAEMSQSETQRLREKLGLTSVEVHAGDTRFLGPHEIEIRLLDGHKVIEGEKILLAVGTKAIRPDHFPFNAKCVFDTDDVLSLDSIPRSMIVVGAEHAGLECALLFAMLGVVVTIVDGRERLLEFCDREIVQVLLSHCHSLGMMVRTGEEVIAVDRVDENRVFVQLESGDRLTAEAVLINAGRRGDTDELNLHAAGLQADERGRIWCNEEGQTWVNHVYAAGDVVGFPMLASVSMQAGRRAIRHAFGQQIAASECISYALSTIPEISMVGRSERQLATDNVAYEAGIARFGELGRIRCLDEQRGMLKLLFHRATCALLGIQCIGDSAIEMIKVGQAFISAGASIDCFGDAMFDSSRVAEAYKAAAVDGLAKLNRDTSAQSRSVSMPSHLPAGRRAEQLMTSCVIG